MAQMAVLASVCLVRSSGWSDVLFTSVFEKRMKALGSLVVRDLAKSWKWWALDPITSDGNVVRL